MLCTVGDLLEDVVVWMSADPRRGTDTPVQVFRRRGGSAANVAALTVAAGGAARFVGQIGDDEVATALLDHLRSEGVDTVVTCRGRTGTIVVLVDTRGERSFLTDRGACTQLAAVPDGVLDGVDVLHVPAYSLVVDPLAATTLELIGDAVARRVPVTVDASSVSALGDFGPGEFLALLSEIGPAALFCNEAEADLLGLGDGCPAPGCALTVVKRGQEPTLVITPAGTTTTFAVPPVDRIVDSTGAGDAFAAGFLLALGAGRPTSTAVQAGQLLASRVLTSPGATLGRRP